MRRCLPAKARWRVSAHRRSTQSYPGFEAERLPTEIEVLTVLYGVSVSSRSGILHGRRGKPLRTALPGCWRDPGGPVPAASGFR